MNCEVNYDDCVGVDCNHGYCEDGLDDYQCRCWPGYRGHSCDMEIDECGSDPCQNGGHCTDHVANYTCACPQGTSGKGAAFYFNAVWHFSIDFVSHVYLYGFKIQYEGMSQIFCHVESCQRNRRCSHGSKDLFNIK